MSFLIQLAITNPWNRKQYNDELNNNITSIHDELNNNITSIHDELNNNITDIHELLAGVD